MTEELNLLREALRRVKYEAASLADAQVIALEALTQRPAAQAEREVQEARSSLESIIKQYRIKADDAHWLRASLPAPQQSTPGWSYAQVRVVDENTLDIGRVVAFAQATADPSCKVCQGSGDAPLVTSGEDLCSACYGTGEQIEQATPEPVGEAGTMPGTSGFTMACFHADKVPVGTKLFTRPAPAVPEGFALVPLTDREMDAAIDKAKAETMYGTHHSGYWRDIGRGVLAAAQAKK